MGFNKDSKDIFNRYKLIKEQSVVGMDPTHFDYSDPYWQTPEGKTEKADREQRYNAMIERQKAPQSTPTPASSSTPSPSPTPSQSGGILNTLGNIPIGRSTTYQYNGQSEPQSSQETTYRVKDIPQLASKIPAKAQEFYNDYKDSQQGGISKEEEAAWSHADSSFPADKPIYANDLYTWYNRVQQDPNAAQSYKDTWKEIYMDRMANWYPDQFKYGENPATGKNEVVLNDEQPNTQATTNADTTIQEPDQTAPAPQTTTTPVAQTTTPPTPQTLSDPFQAKIDQINQQTQQWQASPGIIQVNRPQPQSVSQMNSQFNSGKTSYTSNYLPQKSKPTVMPFTATK